MSKTNTQLRFLLSLGNTKMVVLSENDDLKIYSNHTGKSSQKRKIVAERVTEALIQ
jgi:hypothetical protein